VCVCGFVAAGGVMLLLHEKLDLHIERHLVSGPLPCVQCVAVRAVHAAVQRCCESDGYGFGCGRAARTAIARRPPNPFSSPGLRHARRESLRLVPRSNRTIFCLPVPDPYVSIRNFCTAVRCPRAPLATSPVPPS
jgi:hypothetical protein